MTKTLPISEVKTHLPELITGVQERNDEIIVTKKGRPAAIVMSIDEYESLKETLEVLGDQDLMAQIKRSEEYFAKGGKGYSYEEVFGKDPGQPPKKSR